MKRRFTNKTCALCLLCALYILLCPTACEDYLNDRPEATSVAEGTDYSKPTNIFLPISAAYASLRKYDVHDWQYINLYEIASDDADKGSTPEDGTASAAIDAFTFGASGEMFNAAWEGNYNVVSAANFAIHEMPKYEEAQATAENKQYARECVAEAKVIRAYAYFNLVRLFGNVYIADTTYSADELANLPLQASKDIYAFIEKDLNEAIPVLPEKYGKSWDGRINKYTALAIKAKVCLYQAKWNDVAACAGEIIASGQYDLLPAFRDVFRSQGENSVESLFEIQSSTLGKTSGDAPYLEYAFHQGPRSNTPGNMQGWGFCVPSQSLRDFFAARKETIRAEVTLMKSDDMFEGSFIKRGPNCPDYYNGKTFSPPDENNWSYNGYGFDYNVRIIRYADVLLMYAEALTEGGVDPLHAMSASDALNKVHRRAGFTTIISPTLDNIHDERHAELALEEDRFFDLVRTGQAAAVLGAKGFQAGKHNVYPIPSKQMDLNQNLVQNPGY